MAATVHAQGLVRLDAVAVTTKGEPVADLQASDLQIREDGKLRPIAFFSRTGAIAPQDVLAPGEYANRAQPAPTVILLDRWNERLGTNTESWIDLTAALQKMESVNRIYIYILTAHGELFPVRALPDANADLRLGAEPSPAALSAALDAAVKKLNGFRDVDAHDPGLRALQTFRILTNLAQRFAAVPGRKNLIWVTHGFPLTIRLPGHEFEDLTPFIRDFCELAAQSEIAVYSVDESASGAGADPSSLARATLEEYSGYTGGRWYPSGYIDKALADSLTDARALYRIVYEAPERKRDRKDHKIRIETSRKDVRILTRNSDRGQTPDIDPTAMERTAFGIAAHSPFDATQIGMRVTRSEPEAGKVNLQIRIDPAAIFVEQTAGAAHGQVSVMVARYKDGALKDMTEPVRVDLNAKAENWAAIQKNGIRFTKELPVEGIDHIRVVVFDDNGFGSGSVTFPVR